jgi:hypothetical protein
MELYLLFSVMPLEYIFNLVKIWANNYVVLYFSLIVLIMLFQYNSLLISHLIRCIAFFKHNYLLFLFFKNLDKPGKKTT